MRIRAWILYLAAALVAVAGYFLTPADTWTQTIYAELVGLCATGAIVVGVVRHRPGARAAWLWFAAGQLLNVLGTLAEAVIGRVWHQETWPSLADVLWLGLYPGLAIGLLLLIRRRSDGHDWSSLVAATTITTGLGLLSWVFVIRPIAADSSLSLVPRLVSIAYPVGDLLVLAMVARLLVGGGSRNLAFRLLAGALVLYLVGDATWAVLNYVGVEPGPAAAKLLQMNFLSAYVLVGAAGDPRLPGVAPPGHRRGRHRDRLDGPVPAGGDAHGAAHAADRAPGQAARPAHPRRRAHRLPNRRAWSVELPAAIERARRDQFALSIAMLDLDHFKRFNDEYGHQAGDRLLKSVAAAWRERLRTVDQLARYGGEEFIVLLPGADRELATSVLERLRAVRPAGQTFSAGVATWDGIETSEELITRSDEALYQAKAAGRDRIVVASGQPRPAAGRGFTVASPDAAT